MGKIQAKVPSPVPSQGWSAIIRKTARYTESLAASVDNSFETGHVSGPRVADVGQRAFEVGDISAEALSGQLPEEPFLARVAAV